MITALLLHNFMINCYFTDILLIFEIKFVILQSKRNNIQILIDK